jgi:hypothetical protein
MRFARVLNSSRWTYAIGEIFLIVVGVTIALAANSWYEDRQERNNEILALQQLRQALEIDLDELETNYEIEIQINRKVSELLDHLLSEAPYSTEVGSYFGSIARWVGIRNNTAPYEALKSHGFDLISNDSLRLKLIYYYENQFPTLKGAQLNDRAFTWEFVFPYFYSNFDRIGPNAYLPKDYQKLREDSYFRHLCISKLNRLQSRILPYYEANLTMIRAILSQIEAELR